MRCSPNRYTTTPKRDKIQQQQNRSLLVHIAELSTAVLKVINVSLTQNQCLQCAPPASTHAEILRPRNNIELNNDGVIKMGDIHY